MNGLSNIFFYLFIALVVLGFLFPSGGSSNLFRVEKMLNVEHTPEYAKALQQEKIRRTPKDRLLTRIKWTLIGLGVLSFIAAVVV